MRGGLFFGIRIGLTQCNCPGCLCTPLIELNQINWNQTTFYWVRWEGECIYHFSCHAEKNATCSSSYPALSSPRQVDAANISTMGAALPLMVSSPTPQWAQHKTVLSSWLKVLCALISYTLLCYRLDSWIPLVRNSGQTFWFLKPARGFRQR